MVDLVAVKEATARIAKGDDSWFEKPNSQTAIKITYATVRDFSKSWNQQHTLTILNHL